jgi:tungstate transport system substrate-binding protein
LKKKSFTLSGFLLSVMMITTSVVGCSNTPAGTALPPTTTDQGVNVLKPEVRLKVATTSSLYDTGLWALLEPMFEKQYGCKVDILYANTGLAMTYGQRGDVDVIAVHDRTKELQFITDGYGTQRYVFAYNYFTIVGPANDPLGLKGLSPEDAFRKLAASKTTPFISRGDTSGTYSKELAIWKSAGLDYQTIRNSGAWYVEAGQGMGPTLAMAGQKQAYTLSDIGTFLSYKTQTGLVSLVDTGSIMLNVYSVIPINPAKVTINNSQADLAVKFAQWMVSPDIQKIIGQYGVKDYGMPLFTPCAGAEPTA